jgi:hypothetical protein
MRIPFATRLALPLEASFSPWVVWCSRERLICGWATAIPARTAKASATAMSARQRQAMNAAPTTTTRSAAKLDCENEIRRPSQVTTSAATAVSDQRKDRPSTTSRIDGAIASTRKRP